MALKNDGVTVTHTREKRITFDMVLEAFEAATQAVLVMPLEATHEQAMKVARLAKRAHDLVDQYASQQR